MEVCPSPAAFITAILRAPLALRLQKCIQPIIAVTILTSINTQHLLNGVHLGDCELFLTPSISAPRGCFMLLRVARNPKQAIRPSRETQRFTIYPGEQACRIWYTHGVCYIA